MSGYDDVINPLIPRDRYKRPMIIDHETGEETPYTRCTTFIDTIESRYNLEKWGQRKTLEGAGLRRDLVTEAQSLGREPDKMIKNSMGRWLKNPDHERWRTAMDALVEEAKDAAASTKAAHDGTTIHRLCENQDRHGKINNMPMEFVAHLAAYGFATQRIENIKIETFMVNDRLRVGGTPDRIVSLPGKEKPVILDIKTGSMDWGQLKMAMQLAIYAHSMIYDPETAERTELDLDLETGVICHIDALTAEVVLLEIDIARGWQAVETAWKVRQWRSVRNLTKPLHLGDNLPSREIEKRNRLNAFSGKRKLAIPADLALVTALREADTEEELTMIYRAEHREAWPKDHTEHAKRRKAEILAALAFSGAE